MKLDQRSWKLMLVTLPCEPFYRSYVKMSDGTQWPFIAEGSPLVK